MPEREKSIEETLEPDVRSNFQRSPIGAFWKSCHPSCRLLEEKRVDVRENVERQRGKTMDTRRASCLTGRIST